MSRRFAPSCKTSRYLPPSRPRRREPIPPRRSAALSQSIAANLTPQPGQQSIADIQTDFANAQTEIKAATARQTQTQAMMQNMIDQTENVSTDQVASELLAVQNSLQASYQATSMLSQLIAWSSICRSAANCRARKSRHEAARAMEASLRGVSTIPGRWRSIRCGRGSRPSTPARASALSELVRAAGSPARQRRRSAAQHRSGERDQRLWLPALAMPERAELCLEYGDLDFGARLRRMPAARGNR